MELTSKQKIHIDTLLEKINVEELKSDYESGLLTFSEMQKKYGVGNSYFLLLLDYLGIDRNQASSRNSKTAKIANSIDIELFKKLYVNDLLSLKQIAKELNVSVTVVKYVIENNGLTRNLSDIRKDRSTGRVVGQEVKDKVKSTVLEKYGVEHYFQTEQFKEQSKSTCLNKYGVDNASKSEQIQEKIKGTTLDRYGVDSVMKVPDIVEKQRDTVSKKYGVANVFESDDIKEKIRKTNIERYGNECVSKAESVKAKTKKTNIEKYGTEYPMQNTDIKAKAVGTNIKKYGYSSPAKNEEVLEKINKVNVDKYGVDWTCQLPQCRISGTSNSSANIEFENLLKSAGIEFEREFSVGSYSYDFRVDNTLIEINPTITHNVDVSPFNKCVDSSYHLKKSTAASEHGYRCIHLFDWDDAEKAVKLLSGRERVFARKCSVEEVPVSSVSQLLNEFHFQGNAKADVCIALKLDGEVIACMTFGKPRYNKNYQYELVRYCSKCDVVGGPEKLFKHFLDAYKPDSVVSYCDVSKFSGDTYIKLGFKYVKTTSPNVHWVSLKTKRHITNNLLLQRGYDQLFGTNYGKGTSNEELMLNSNFVRVYDCGQKVYSYTKEV